MKGQAITHRHPPVSQVTPSGREIMLTVRLVWPRLASIDVNGSPKILPRDAVTAMQLESKGWLLDPEILIKAHYMGLRILEFNVFARMRGSGLSHVRPGHCWEFTSAATGLSVFRVPVRVEPAHRPFRDDIGKYPQVTESGFGAPVHQTRRVCRGCDSVDLAHVLSLGQTPLANAFLESDAEFEDEVRYPLELYVCPRCWLVQLVDVIDPITLFGNYIYVTGTSTTMGQHNSAYAASIVKRFGLDRSSVVVDIASNDGSLLSHFSRYGVQVVGVEPAANLAELASAEGIRTVNAFFDRPCAANLRSTAGPADVVLANNVLAHVDNPREFLIACRELLAPGGHLVIEVPYLRDLLERLEYDTVYHEHLSYFSVTALHHLFAVSGLFVANVERVSVHGGSLRVYGTALDSGEAGGCAASVAAFSRRRAPARDEPLANGSVSSLATWPQVVSKFGLSPGAEAERPVPRGVRSAGEGQYAPQLLRYRLHPRSIYSRPESAKSWSVYARNSPPSAARLSAARAPAGLHAPSRLESG